MRVLISVLLFMLAVLPVSAADRMNGDIKNLAIQGYKDPDLTGGGSGTVTSVTISGGSTGLTFSGGPVTHSQPITLGGVLAKSAGGNGTASSGVVGFTKAVPNGRNCWCETVSRVTAGVAHCRAQPTSTTQNTFKNYDSTMTEAPWVAGGIVQVSCQGR